MEFIYSVGDLQKHYRNVLVRGENFAFLYGSQPTEVGMTLVDGHHRLEVLREYYANLQRTGLLHLISRGMNNPCAEIPLTPRYEATNLHHAPIDVLGNTAWTQHRFIARHAFRLLYPTSAAFGVIDSLGKESMNQKKRKQLVRLAGENELARELIFEFYNQKRRNRNWSLTYRSMRYTLPTGDDQMKFCDLLGAMYYDAIGFGSTVSLERQYRTVPVVALLKGMRATEDWSMMPILADALDDAGWPLPALTTHLRDPNAVFTLGGWLFRTMGYV